MIRVVADLGNSRLKWGRVEADGRLGETLALPLDDPAAWAKAWDSWRLHGGAAWTISSVNPPLAERFARFLAEQGASQVRWCRSVVDVAIEHDVTELHTGGADRALAVVGALARRRERGQGPGIVVMCGTAITVERVSAEGVWLGGAIAAGFRLIAEALHRGTAQLPLIELGQRTPAPVGRATVPSLEAGIFWGVVGTVRELVARQEADATGPGWRIWTGGDASALAAWVDGPDAEIAPHLVLEGLVLQ